MPSALMDNPGVFRTFMVRWCVTTFGFFLNASIVLVTVKSKSLRSHCNILIAFEAGFCALYQMNVMATLAIAISGSGTIPVRICCLVVQPAFVAGFYSYMTTVLLIALDRLSSILFPFWYNGQKTHNYLLLMLVACLFSSGYNLEGKFRWVLQDEQKSTMVPCQLGDCNGAWNMALSHSETAFINGCTIVAYIILWAVLVFAKGKTPESRENIKKSNRIFRALAVLVIVYSFFTFGSAFVNAILDHLHLNPDTYNLAIFILGIFANLSYSISMPALVTFSLEYRRSYQKFLFCKSVTPNSTVQVMPINTAVNNRNNITHNTTGRGYTNNTRW